MNPRRHVCSDKAWMNAVDTDTQRRHLGRSIASESFDGELRRGVMRASGKNFGSLYGADVHDVRFAAFRDHAAAKDLGTKPGSAQVDIGHAGPLFVGDLKERNDGLDRKSVV